MQRLLAKHDMDLSHLNQEHAVSAAKVDQVVVHSKKIAIVAAHSHCLFSPGLSSSAFQSTEVMEEFEKTIDQLKLQLLDAEHQRHQQVKVGFPGQAPVISSVLCHLQFYGLFALTSFQEQELKFQQQKDEVRISLETKVAGSSSSSPVFRRSCSAQRKSGRAEIKRLEPRGPVSFLFLQN